MSTYRAPLADMHFVMNDLAGLSQVAALPGYEEATPDTVAAILEEAGRFAREVLDPLNFPGDREGSKLMPDGSVKTPAGFKAAYHQFVDNGWNGLTKSPDYGGQGLPHLVATAVEEMWHGIVSGQRSRSSGSNPRSRARGTLQVHRRTRPYGASR